MANLALRAMSQKIATMETMVGYIQRRRATERRFSAKLDCLEAKEDLPIFRFVKVVFGNMVLACGDRVGL